jgi:competence protein ComEC
MLPGDIEARGEKDLVVYWRRAMQSELLLAGHHGSATSSSIPWIKTIQPRQLVFSSGYLNQFGHPHSSIIARFEQRGTSTFSTALDGALEIYFDPNQPMLIKSYRTMKQRYWM